MPSIRTVKTVDLSIDYDFFIREDPDWDFGHSEYEGSLAHLLWVMRYETFDLHRETAPERFADFMPTARSLFAALDSRGLRLDPLGRSVLCIADDHAAARDFFCDQPSAADYILNLDAHHDAYSGAGVPLSCENWIPHFLACRPATRVLQVYPTWKDPLLDGRPCVKMRRHRWPDFHFRQPAMIRHVFLCRSSPWVPPHHDGAFARLAAGLQKLVPSSRNRVEQLPLRPAPSIEVADSLRANFQRRYA